ncbi:MAG: FAD-dependent oxidoreductase [Desulfobulbaceae bacterium]|jgi:formate dehydrogenase beta subunit|nr:FAD-dependent oxidoreductase [Desulfobulbaceae bacterium]
MANSVFNSWGSEVKPLRYGARDVAAVVAWGEVSVTDPNIDIVGLCAEYAHAVRDNSCGHCIPCRVGTQVIADLLDKIVAGQGSESHLDQIIELADTIGQASFCDIGQTSPKAIAYMIEHFRADFVSAIKTPPQKGSYAYKSFVTAPCMQACPIHLNIPQYIEDIKRGRFQESLDVIKSKLPIPGVVGRVCVRPCETACQRGRADGALQIKHLKRFVADVALARQAEAKPSSCCSCGAAQKSATKDARVAIIGAGPAGVTCANVLAKEGYKVTIFEMLPEPGGMAAVGIPDYRLPREILRGEIGETEKLGVEIQYNKALGKDFTIESLKADGFKAIFVAMGCHTFKKMRVEGEDAGYYGFVPGVTFLRNVNLGRLDELPKGKSIAVVGGGNVAIDCVRTAFRVGFTDANLVYRRTIKEMPADPVEIHDAEAEEVKFHFLVAPKRIVAENGKVVGLECSKMELGEPDASGRRRPVEIPGSEYVIPADVVVSAIGQEVDTACTGAVPGVELDKWGIMVVDENLMTAVPGLFAGGDYVSGPDTLIGACAHGRLVGKKIAKYLAENVIEKLPEEDEFALVKQLQTMIPAKNGPLPAGVARAAIAHEPAAERKVDFREVDKGFTATEAAREADRCLRCYRIVTCACQA